MSAAPSTESTPSFSYAPGDVIASKYLLEELIGEGGMGAVFRARNTSLDMLVAIKLMRADLNRELLAGRLLQEARAAAKLTHPGIVRVFDVGQTALGDPFIVMELLEGEPLSALLDRERKLAPVHAVQLLLPIADALSAAHAKGLVHRDVKPDNVLLIVSEEGMVQPKLLDFGIVTSAQADEASGRWDAGSIVGSPDYMSPEQVCALERIDARSDLWSFSVLLYEAIAGVTPFQATDYQTLLRMIVQDDPKSLSELGVASHALSYIVARGLSKEPTDRYPSLNQMGRALAAWLADQGISEDACGVSLEAKWLTRLTDPLGLARASWPPPARAEQVSGVHDLSVIVPGTAPVLSVPPSSHAPVVHESASTERGARRSVLVGALAFTATLIGCLALANLRSQPQRVPVAFEATSAKRASDVASAAAPVAIASTVLPAAPSASASAEGVRKPREPKADAPKRVPAAPPAAPLATARAREGRPSDVLAPMPF